MPLYYPTSGREFLKIKDGPSAISCALHICLEFSVRTVGQLLAGFITWESQWSGDILEYTRASLQNYTGNKTWFCFLNILLPLSIEFHFTAWELRCTAAS